MFLYFLHDVMIVFLPVQLTAYNETANLVSNTDTVRFRVPCSVFMFWGTFLNTRNQLLNV